MSEPLTDAAFDRALASWGISPDPEDRDAAFTIACYLEDCVQRLREAEADETADVG